MSERVALHRSTLTRREELTLLISTLEARVAEEVEAAQAGENLSLVLKEGRASREVVLSFTLAMLESAEAELTALA